MKKNVFRLAGVFSIIALCLILSCRKQTETMVKTVDLSLSSAINSAQLLHKEKTTAFGPLLAILQDRIDPVTLQPNWKEAYLSKLSDGTDILIVPVGEKALHNNQISIFRKLIFTYHDSKVTEGNIVEFLGDEKFLSSHIHLFKKPLI